MPDNHQHRKNPCPAWIWLVLVIGLAILYFVYNHAISKKAQWIQQDIQSRIDQNYANSADFENVSASVDGRDITLHGNVSQQDIFEHAQQVAVQTLGVRQVSNQLKIKPATDSSSETAAPAPADQAPKPAAPKSMAKVEPLPEEFAPLEEQIATPIEDKPEENKPSENKPAENEAEAQESVSLEVAQAALAEQALSQLDFSNITFAKNSTELTPSAQSTLDLATTTLTENPTVNIEVNGHTDSSGNPELNLKLSKQRAQAVLEYFINQGIDSDRIKANGYGDQFPIAPNDTQAGRIMNRRIEIKVINGE